MGAGARAYKTALKIYCKSSLEYLGTLVVAGGELARGFDPKGLAGWSDNLLPDLGGGEESGEAMEGVTEGATEGRSWRERLRP